MSCVNVNYRNYVCFYKRCLMSVKLRHFGCSFCFAAMGSTIPVTTVNLLFTLIFPFPLNSIFLLALTSPGWSIWLLSVSWDSYSRRSLDLVESSILNPSKEGWVAVFDASLKTLRNLLFCFDPWTPAIPTLFGVLWWDPWWPIPCSLLFVVSPWWWWWWWLWWLKSKKMNIFRMKCKLY